jgi:CRISPR-associated protein Csc1
MRAHRVHLWLAEPIFFASRELSDTYLTEGLIGNYALAYALGWAQSPWRLWGKQSATPTYEQDLQPLAGTDYVLPAWPTAPARYRFERFNALSDAYWFMMTNNRVATAREELPAIKAGEKPGSFRPSNFPQSGRLRLLERGQTFETIVFSERELPAYIRVGKFNSKVKVQIQSSHEVTHLASGEFTFSGALNPADVPESTRLLSYNMVNMPPVPILQQVRFQGEAIKVGDYTLPAHMCFMGISP